MASNDLTDLITAAIANSGDEALVESKSKEIAQSRWKVIQVKLCNIYGNHSQKQFRILVVGRKYGFYPVSRTLYIMCN